MIKLVEYAGTMEKIKIEKRKNSVKLFLSGELAVEDALLLKEKLQKTVKTTKKIEVIFDKETEVHVAVIQVILALQKYFTLTGKGFLLRDTESPSVKKLLETLGCSRFFALS